MLATTLYSFIHAYIQCTCFPTKERKQGNTLGKLKLKISKAFYMQRVWIVSSGYSHSETLFLIIDSIVTESNWSLGKIVNEIIMVILN